MRSMLFSGRSLPEGTVLMHRGRRVIVWRHDIYRFACHIRPYNWLTAAWWQIERWQVERWRAFLNGPINRGLSWMLECGMIAKDPERFSGWSRLLMSFSIWPPTMAHRIEKRAERRMARHVAVYRPAAENHWRLRDEAQAILDRQAQYDVRN